MPKGCISFSVLNRDGKARTGVLHLEHSDVPTPIYMPVGTQGTLKGLSSEQIGEIGPPIMLSNTYYLTMRPGPEALLRYGGLHKFMGLPKGTSLLTDSGGFQMVSLCSLLTLNEEGVTFKSPQDHRETLLTPEKSIETQCAIGSDIMMALDDVVSSTCEDMERHTLATNRTERWLDRCIKEHKKNIELNKVSNIGGGIFAICQGWLDISPGGMREQCIKYTRERLERGDVGGIAIGGLSGGENKVEFIRTVAFTAARLPGPTYLMGVGHPVDLVLCAGLGVDMFDCVYATRTARFGVALTDDGQLDLRRSEKEEPMVVGCECYACRTYKISYLHALLQRNIASAGVYISIHNVSYLLNLMKRVRESITAGTMKTFVKSYVANWYRNESELPDWVVEGIRLMEEQK